MTNSLTLTQSLRDLAFEVYDWNEKAGQLEDCESVYSNEEDRELALVIIREEVDELEEALKNEDEVEVVDAVCDIIFTALGAAAKAGVSKYIGACMVEVIESNNSKLEGEREVKSNGKLGKGSKYRPPQIGAIMNRIDNIGY